MPLGLLRATDEDLGEADRGVSRGQIPVQRQGALAFRDGLESAVRVDLDTAQNKMRQRVMRRYVEGFGHVGYGGGEARGSISWRHTRPRQHLDPGPANQRAHIFGIERQGACEKTASPGQIIEIGIPL